MIKQIVLMFYVIIFFNISLYLIYLDKNSLDEILSFNYHIEKINSNQNNKKLLYDFFNYSINSKFPSSRNVYFDEDGIMFYEYLSISLNIMYREYIRSDEIKEKEKIKKYINKILNKVELEINNINYPDKENNIYFNSIEDYVINSNIGKYLNNIGYLCSLHKLEEKYRRVLGINISKNNHILKRCKNSIYEI